MLHHIQAYIVYIWVRIEVQLNEFGCFHPVYRVLCDGNARPAEHQWRSIVNFHLLPALMLELPKIVCWSNCWILGAGIDRSEPLKCVYTLPDRFLLVPNAFTLTHFWKFDELCVEHRMSNRLWRLFRAIFGGSWKRRISLSHSIALLLHFPYYLAHPPSDEGFECLSSDIHQLLAS